MVFEEGGNKFHGTDSHKFAGKTGSSSADFKQANFGLMIFDKKA